MCYNTRQSRKKKDLQEWANLRASLGEVPDDLELIYFSANGWSHPIMWTITQERPDFLSPNMWGIMPAKEKMRAVADGFEKGSRSSVTPS